MTDKLPALAALSSFSGKTVFVRLDTDVPLTNGVIEDDTRLQTGWPTIAGLLKGGATVIAAGHLNRPGGVVKKEASLLPVAKWFAKKTGWAGNDETPEIARGEFPGWKIKENLILLENLRFFKGEEENDTVFAKSLASLADIYVDDAFAVSHRAHASNVGITAFLPGFAGLRFAEEISVLRKVISDPKRPLVVIIGGAKLETKLPLVQKMDRMADYVLVGGKIALEKGDLLRVQHEKIKEKRSILLVAELNDNGTDITATSVENFLQVIRKAGTIIWNGPVGKMGNLDGTGSEEGTNRLAKGVAKSGAYSVVGGGDTLEFIRKKGLSKSFNFCSTGGGAMLAFLSGEKLPALAALTHHSLR